MFRRIRYTFEYYDDKIETRKWYERFIKEHNRVRKAVAHSAATRAITQRPPSQFVRIHYDGDLIGYARCTRVFDARNAMTINDVFIRPPARHKGHYHAMLPDLARFTNATAVTLAKETYEKHRFFYASIGFRNCLTVPGNEELVRVATDARVAAAQAANAALKEAA